MQIIEDYKEKLKTAEENISFLCTLADVTSDVFLVVEINNEIRELEKQMVRYEAIIKATEKAEERN